MTMNFQRLKNGIRGTILLVEFVLVALLSLNCNSGPQTAVPTDFNIIYKFDSTETLNTFDSTYQRDYFARSCSIYFFFSEPEKLKIYTQIVENNLFSLPDTFICKNKSNCSTEYFIVELNGKRKSILFNNPSLPENSQHSYNYLNITNTIKDIVKKNDFYGLLPNRDSF
jgi:hypothetical protein